MHLREVSKVPFYITIIKRLAYGNKFIKKSRGVKRNRKLYKINILYNLGKNKSLFYLSFLLN